LAILAASPAEGETSAKNNYGAIAYSPSTHAIGWSYDYGSHAAAEDAALVNCRKQANDCVTHWFRDACGALAVGPKGYGMAWGATGALPESNGDFPPAGAGRRTAPSSNGSARPG
jgi:serine/threonine-protein kinase